MKFKQYIFNKMGDILLQLYTHSKNMIQTTSEQIAFNIEQCHTQDSILILFPPFKRLQTLCHMAQHCNATQEQAIYY